MPLFAPAIFLALTFEHPCNLASARIEHLTHEFERCRAARAAALSAHNVNCTVIPINCHHLMWIRPVLRPLVNTAHVSNKRLLPFGMKRCHLGRKPTSPSGVEMSARAGRDNQAYQ